MDQKVIELKHALEQRIGFTINSIQRCKQLDAWLKEYNIFISYSTLSRIFGFNKNGVIPRQRTLDLLCSVIGYSNYESFITREFPFVPHVLYKTENSTIGELLVDGIWECFTLEDVERPVKIKGETAIPKGTYKVIINESNRFKYSKYFFSFFLKN